MSKVNFSLNTCPHFQTVCFHFYKHKRKVF